MAKYKVEINGIDTNKLKVLTNDEMITLFKEYQKGNQEAKEEIINGNLKLVLSIINKYNNGKHDMNDLFQIGCVGLIKAVDNFSLEYNVQFSTYAVPLIIGEVKRFIRDSSTVRISRSIRDNAYQILKYKDEYMLKHGIEPSNREICDNLNLSEYELASSLESLIAPMSLFDPIYNDGGDTIYLMDQVKDPKVVAWEEKVSQAQAASHSGSIPNKKYEEMAKAAKKEGVLIQAFTGRIAQAERQCFNAMIQGSAGTLTKKAMSDIFNDEELKKYDAHLIITVHDEVLVECKEEYAELVEKSLPEIMIKAAVELGITAPKMKCDPYNVSRWYADSAAVAVRSEFEKLEKKESRDEAIEDLCKKHPEFTKECILKSIETGCDLDF